VRRIAGAFLLFLLFSNAESQPIERNREFRTDELRELVMLDSTIKLDIRYATVNNFMKRKMYSQARAFLQRSAAEALVRVSARLKKFGYGILVFDAYRPWSVTKKFWDATSPAKRIYVANPKKGSKHNRGCAVDLSLFELKSGREVPMPTPYDDFSQNAAADCPCGTPEQRRTRALLRGVMESEGFVVNSDEWWHFDFVDWQKYQVLNIPFEQLK
jgi:D-alanyl-D-alanine dipeptidase